MKQLKFSKLSDISKSQRVEIFYKYVHYFLPAYHGILYIVRHSEFHRHKTKPSLPQNEQSNVQNVQNAISSSATAPASEFVESYFAKQSITWSCWYLLAFLMHYLFCVILNNCLAFCGILLESECKIQYHLFFTLHQVVLTVVVNRLCWIPITDCYTKNRI